MSEKIVSTTARDAVRNFTHYAAMVEAGAEVIITRRGCATLKLVRVEPTPTPVDRKALVQQVLSIRAAQPFKGNFARREADES